MKKELFNHEDAVLDGAYQSYLLAAQDWKKCRNPWRIHSTIIALANWQLARDTDREETLDRAANRELAERLLDCLACERGMNKVGVHATSWFDLGARIADAYEDGWLRFCYDETELDDVFDEIERGWFSVTTNDWRDPYNEDDEDDEDREPEYD